MLFTYNVIAKLTIKKGNKNLTACGSLDNEVQYTGFVLQCIS